MGIIIVFLDFLNKVRCMSERKKVFVGLSGGVDSSVSAYLLKKAGYNVTGVFIKVWQPEFIPCTWREDRLDAMKVAAHLSIPFITLDLEKEYKKEVIDYMISEYKAGRTPNPDVFCNKHVKFGAFLKWALKNGADYVATGHYAKISFQRPASSAQLLRGDDEGKDQTYFLWTLTQKQLRHILFPVGHLKKEAVREIARKAKLATAEKKDSQGLCFISNVDMKQFLKHFMSEKKGKILNEKGEIIGTHRGALFHTIGERHGFTVNKKTPNDKPYYVVKKNVSKNEIVVSHVLHPPKFSRSKNLGGQATYELEKISWIEEEFKDRKIKAQIRYHGEEHLCTVSSNPPRLSIGSYQGLALGNRVLKNIVTFKKSILVSPGQSVVFYNGEICLGGGIIK